MWLVLLQVVQLVGIVAGCTAGWYCCRLYSWLVLLQVVQLVGIYCCRLYSWLVLLQVVQLVDTIAGCTAGWCCWRLYSWLILLQVVQLVGRNPTLLTCGWSEVEHKYWYVTEVMGIDAGQMVKTNVMTYSLQHIQTRHS